MRNFEEFVLEGRNFNCIDLSAVTNTDELTAFTEATKPLIAKYPENSLYIITSVAGIMFDTESKSILIEYMEHNNNYVKACAIIEMDGMTKVVAASVAKLAGRSNVHFAFTRDQAIVWLLGK